nr:MAG TPA: hypothetical protein [Caudoviricetes sp.]
MQTQQFSTYLNKAYAIIGYKQIGKALKRK